MRSDLPRPCVWLCRDGVCPYADPSVRADLDPAIVPHVLACLQHVYATGRSLAGQVGPDDDTETARPRDVATLPLFAEV